MTSLTWGLLAIAVALAYTAWSADGASERDVRALWFCCGFSFILAGLFAVVAYASSE